MRGVTVTFLYLILALGAFAQTALRISGSGTVYYSVVREKLIEVQEKTGLAADVRSSNSGLGFASLIKGGADIAMSSEPLLSLARKHNVKSELFREIHLCDEQIFFILNRENGVTQLDASQCRAILKGELSNWKQLGGADLPIVIVSEAPGGGTHGVLCKNFLGSQELPPQTVYVKGIQLVAPLVQATKGAIGYCPSFMVGPEVQIVKDLKVLQSLNLIVRKDSPTSVIKLAEAFASK